MKNYSSFNTIQRSLKDGSLTCSMLVRHYLEKIEEKKHLNALLEVYADEALEKAEAVDRKLRDGTAGKLAGMVITLKDVLSHKNHRVQGGSKILQNFEAQYDATAVKRLLGEDAIVIGRNNCDEFGMGSSNENSAFGPVLNDAAPSRVPGGSSGGSAAAVQAGLCLVSIGTDTGGSVRQPAAFCGLVGFKPTYSRISRYGLFAYASSFDCIGVLANNVEDVALVLEVMAGVDPFDSTVSGKEVPAYSASLSDPERKYKIAYIEETVASDGLNEEIKKNMADRIDTLKRAGHNVESVSFPMLDYILPTYYILTTAEAGSNLSRYDGVRYGYRSPNGTTLEAMYKKTRSEGFGEEVKRRIMLGTFVLSASYYDAYYSKAQKVRRLIRDSSRQLLSDYDFLITPTTPTTAFKLGQHNTDPVAMYLADLFTVQASVSGIPAMSIPAGFDSEGLPIGMQIMANDFEEEKLLAFSNYMTSLI